MVSVRVVIPLLFLHTTLIEGHHVCHNNDLTAFCVIFRQLKALTQRKDPPAYPQFQKMFNLKGFPTEAYKYAHETSQVGLPELNNSIFTYQDLCDNEHKGRLKLPNPYHLNVTQISVNGSLLHNWLHLSIKAHEPHLAQASGRMKMGFLVVNDENGFPVGDFNHDIPCGVDCNCKRYTTGKPGIPQCLQAKRSEHVPCMVTDDKVMTHPGMMMFYDDDGFDEVHASWHFAQSADPDKFKGELHFIGLMVEDLTEQTLDEASLFYNFGDYPKNANTPSKRTGIFGWSPQYKILFPTEKTLGGWDFYRKGVYHQQDIKCHEPLTNASGLFKIVDYPSLLLDAAGERADGLASALNMIGARDKPYAFLDNVVNSTIDSSNKSVDVIEARPPQLYYGLTRNKSAPGVEELDRFHRDDNMKHYNPMKTKVLDYLKTLLQVTPEHLKSDRCNCPHLPTPLPPELEPPPPLQIQGRKSHASQMLIAWLCLVPFGIFVSRFFKETYSKVFFLQEFWWYTIHVLCMLTAIVFMGGGIYVVELKRQEPFKWKDLRTVAHAAVGVVAMSIFGVHACLGFFRLKNIRARFAQIFAHWLFGNLEYLLAMMAIVLSSFIVASGFSCWCLVYFVFWQITQFCFFFGMELHMRHIDRVMNLNPKRTYLPPPIMRVFHENAPESSFRVKVLAVYFVLCAFSVVILFFLIENNEAGESCFHHSKVADV